MGNTCCKVGFNQFTVPVRDSLRCYSWQGVLPVASIVPATLSHDAHSAGIPVNVIMWIKSDTKYPKDFISLRPNLDKDDPFTKHVIWWFQAQQAQDNYSAVILTSLFRGKEFSLLPLVLIGMWYSDVITRRQTFVTNHSCIEIILPFSTTLTKLTPTSSVLYGHCLKKMENPRTFRRC